jgi:hypothetical protein
MAFQAKDPRLRAYAITGQHETLFATSALSIAVIAQTPDIAATLKHWTEETLRAMQLPEQGGRFFFGSIDPLPANPEEFYLSPLWEQAFGSAKTPLLVLE